MAGPESKPEARILALPGWAWGIAAGVCALVVTAVSLAPPRGTPGPQIADLGEVVATLGHLIGYLILAGLIVLATRGRWPWLTWLVVSAYGALLEIVQGSVGLRSFQWSDIAANAAGAAAGIALTRILLRRLRDDTGEDTGGDTG